MGRANARRLGSIPDRLTKILNNNPINRKVRKMTTSFACDYETLERLANIEQRTIARADEDGEYLPVRDARDYALAVEAIK